MLGGATSVAPPSTALPALTWAALARPGLRWPGLGCVGLGWADLVWPGAGWADLVWVWPGLGLGLARSDLNWLGCHLAPTMLQLSRPPRPDIFRATPWPAALRFAERLPSGLWEQSRSNVPRGGASGPPARPADRARRLALPAAPRSGPPARPAGPPRRSSPAIQLAEPPHRSGPAPDDRAAPPIRIHVAAIVSGIEKSIRFPAATLSPFNRPVVLVRAQGKS